MLDGVKPEANPNVRWLLLVAHDTNIAMVRTLMNFSWQLPGYSRGNIPPGSSLALERWRNAKSGERYLRVYFQDVYKRQTLRPTQRISDYQQLGFIKLLSAVSDPALLNDFMHDTLGCLIEPGRKAPWLLLETLETLLQENGNVVRAADRLGLHRNTLHQRIQRIEKLTGYPVSHPQFHLNASVALVIWRLSQNHLQDLSLIHILRPVQSAIICSQVAEAAPPPVRYSSPPWG